MIPSTNTALTSENNSLAQESLTLAIEKAAREHYGSQVVLANLEDRCIIVFYDVPNEMPLNDAKKHDPDIDNGLTLDVVYSFEDFPKKMVNTIREYFTVIHLEIKEDVKYRHWLKRIQRVVKGSILEKSSDKVQVLLSDGSIGTMTRQHWVPNEFEHYYEGNELFFFVLKISRSPLTIHLSRSSRTLPALLMKMEMPWGSFGCKKRYIGQKSVIYTNLERTTNLINSAKLVQTLLLGEIVEVNQTSLC